MAQYLRIKPRQQHRHARGNCCHKTHASAARLSDENASSAPVPSHAQILHLTLSAMDCPAEAALIRRAFTGVLEHYSHIKRYTKNTAYPDQYRHA